MVVHPQGEYIIVAVDSEGEEKTKSGIIIPSQAVAENKKTQTGTVYAAGPGRPDPNDSSKFIPHGLKAGQKVIMGKMIGYPIKIDTVDCVIVKFNDVMAVYE